MSRSVASVFFVALYAVAVFFVCLVNDDAILRDAVVGVSFVAGLYMMFFLPTAAAGAAVVALKGVDRNARGGLAVILAVLLALVLEFLFAVAKAWMLFVVGGNIALILTYFGLGVLFAKRGNVMLRDAAEHTVGPLNMPSVSDICKRCSRKIEVDPALSFGAFEGMHWLCFHLEFEHDTDPDRPCSDFTSCPWWTIRHYEERLRTLEVSPEEVIQSAIHRHAR